MRKFFSILVGKLTYLIAGKIFKRGSSLPGVIALKLNKNILYDFKLPKTVIAVTGSSGKGSTTSIMANVYKNLGYKVCYNDKGSNQVSAIITSLLENSKLNGKVKSDVCIFEMDERYAIQVFPKIKPSHVVVTNITRDQPPRQGSFEEIYNCILNSLNKECKLILNGDDPYLQYFNLDTKNECYFFGIDKTKYSYFKNDYPSLNISRCPKCNKKLEYAYYHLEQLGDYKCSSCDFKRPKLTSMITSYDYNNSLITIDNNYKINIVNNMLYNAYNTLAAFTTLSLNGLDKNIICKLINEISNNKKLYNFYKYNNRDVYVLNNKAENATTYNESVLFSHRDKDLKTIVLGWKEISRRYDFDDISWLYDIDFEMLKKDKIDKFICTGPQKYDLATRLKYAGFDEKKIICFDNLYKAEKIIKRSSGSIYAILNFDYLDFFNDIMKEEK
ncbi:MAG TPA: MurT ligase domain-containing protein [Bacilli bacterium]|nr:MurT ligase domain-containing protein [Bacilli bacterium]